MTMLPTHIFDSSAWISAWGELYAPNVFPRVWERLAVVAENGVVASPRQVIDEIAAKDDALNKWMTPRRKALERALLERKVGDKVEEIVADLRNTYRNLKTQTGADYYVIAWAKTLRIPLVGTENPKATSHKAMAGVCRTERVKFQSPLQFMQAEGWVFS